LQWRNASDLKRCPAQAKSSVSSSNCASGSALWASKPAETRISSGAKASSAGSTRLSIAALHALDAHGLNKVAVVDFDVHHGNGTQTVAEKEPRLVFASTHQAPLYPGTGARSETGIDGNVINAPLPAGAGSAAWRAAMNDRVLPALDAFAPELILVSAGFDAHKADPLAQLELETEDFAWAGRRLKELALRHCKGKLVSTLEGGYDLPALAGSADAYLKALQRD
jgi:acetoin utilization deacetylase AcuC-like enzyme